VLKESWAQRPEPTLLLRRRSKSRESVRGLHPWKGCRQGVSKVVVVLKVA